MNDRAYTGIDYFRVVAAFLVVAIHSSPLLSLGETADFVFTRALARVAVPFFFMVSGFSLFSQTPKAAALKRFTAKTATLYGISILLYLPLNIYMGRGKPLSIFEILKDIIFDGTLYHLWYFPAAITGACIVYLLYRFAGRTAALAISAALYVLGLLGDSYYGITAGVPFLETAYSEAFKLFDYTRNGLFFTPLFMLLGGMAARPGRQAKKNDIKDMKDFIIFFGLMICEALILHKLGLQRHDSMYIMLVPCMYFLFLLLLQARGARKPRCKRFSIIVYIMHPWVIALLHPAAEALFPALITGGLLDNSIFHFILVCIGTSILALIWMKLWGGIRSRWSKTQA
jgi:serine/alanine racemase